MRLSYIHKGLDSTQVVLVFGGFASVPELFTHMRSDMGDVLLCYDYRIIDEKHIIELRTRLCKELRNYTSYKVVAFSMGVCVAQYVLYPLVRPISANDVSAHSLPQPVCIMAVNGTPYGIHKSFGIHPRIYQRTMKHFSLRDFLRAMMPPQDTHKTPHTTHCVGGLDTTQIQAQIREISQHARCDIAASIESNLQCSLDSRYTQAELQSLWEFVETRVNASNMRADSSDVDSSDIDVNKAESNEIQSSRAESKSIESRGVEANNADCVEGCIFTHALISLCDSIFPPQAMRTYFAKTQVIVYYCFAPHFVFGYVDSFAELFELCVPFTPESTSSSRIDSKTTLQIESSSRIDRAIVARKFWEARESYESNTPIQAHMRIKLLELLEAFAPKCMRKSISALESTPLHSALAPTISTISTPATLESARTIHTQSPLSHTYFARIFEFGAGSGAFTRLVQQCVRYKQFVCNDINHHALYGVSDETQMLAFDMYELHTHAIAQEQFSLITSNACLQWLEAERILPQLAAMLEYGGVLLLSTFSTRNMREIAEIFGVGLRYVEKTTLETILKNNGLEVLYCEEEEIMLHFTSPKEVLRHLRASGVNAFGAAGVLSPSKLRAYEKKFGGKLTYNPCYVLARKREQ